MENSERNKTDKLLNDVVDEIAKEVIRSNSIHRPKFVTTSEWLGVIREEYIEWEREIWKHKDQYTCNYEIRKEAIQVAAMMIKGIISFCKEEVIGEDDPEHD